MTPRTIPCSFVAFCQVVNLNQLCAGMQDSDYLDQHEPSQGVGQEITCQRNGPNAKNACVYVHWRHRVLGHRCRLGGGIVNECFGIVWRVYGALGFRVLV